jgi:tetratricopeptide (TPR) repeat protein
MTRQDHEGTGAGRIDADELALLVEERDHLLSSLDDLEREYAAGDMDDVDYLALKDDYTVRAADVLEAIEEQHPLQRSQAVRPGRARTLVVTASVLAFAVLAGVFVAQGSGQRGDGAITGAIDTLRSELARCRTASFQDPAGGVECYDDVLADAPDNTEALTYQGWAYVRSDRVGEGMANFDRVVEIDPDYPDVRVFRAVVASRGGEFELAAREIDRFHRSSPTPAAVQVLRSQGLEREIFIRLLGEPTRECWLGAAATSSTTGDDPVDGGDDTAARDAARFLATLGACLDGVLAELPSDADALVSRAYALLAAGTGELAEGALLAQRALEAEPGDPNALLMHGSVALAEERTEEAAADLDALEDLPRPTISFLIGGPEELRAALAEATGSAASSPTTTASPPSSGSGPATPSIPNRSGG